MDFNIYRIKFKKKVIEILSVYVLSSLVYENIPIFSKLHGFHSNL